MSPSIRRRDVLKRGAGLALAGCMSLARVDFALGRNQEKFMIAVISDAHIQQTRDGVFVRNWDRGLIRAVAEVNLLDPQPDFVVFCGDLAALGRRAELDHGAEILSALRPAVRHVVGETDYYLDLGEYWSKLFGAQWYSFDHKGVHFVVLNSILTDERWTHERWAVPEQRMQAMASLGDASGSPFMVGEQQRAWLAQDLKELSKGTPIVVFSHAPLQRIYKGWNFWTEDAEKVQALLLRFERVNVFYGHVHQIEYSQIGPISFQSVVSTAWPIPYPQTYAQADSAALDVAVPMNRADPFFERDGTGWQFVNLAAGRAEIYYNLYNNSPRTVAFDAATGRPQDMTYPDTGGRIPPQTQY